MINGISIVINLYFFISEYLYFFVTKKILLYEKYSSSITIFQKLV